MNTLTPSSNNLFSRRPLLMYFVLAYAFFWGFLILILLILGLLGLSPSVLPGWLFSWFNIIGSWMSNLAAVTIIGMTIGRAGNRKLLSTNTHVLIG